MLPTIFLSFTCSLTKARENTKVIIINCISLNSLDISLTFYKNAHKKESLPALFKDLYNYINRNYSIISVTTPAPTVLPPSLIANLSPFSIAIGVISSMLNLALSPGITISTPSSSVMLPVTSVVLK